MVMQSVGRTRRQATVIAAVLVAAVAVPKALADDPITVPVDGAAIAQQAVAAAMTAVPEAPQAPIVPETPAVSQVSPVVPPAVSPPPPVPPTPGSPAGTPQSPAGEPSGGGDPSATPGDQTVDPSHGKTPEKISRGITSKSHVILHQKKLRKPKENAAQSCSLIASCTAPEPYPRGAAAAPARGGVRELPPPAQVTATELARGRAVHLVHHAPRSAHRKHVQPGGAGSAPAPLIPAPPGRSPDAPPPSALTFSSSGAHGTGSATVSASVSSFGVAAARAPTTAARSTSVPLRRRGSDDRIDRPG